MNETDPHKQLAAALGRIASGIFILTARRNSLETGMLVSWVQQCAFEPPHLSAAIKCGRPINAWLQPGAMFTLNILDDTQTDMIVHFGRGFQLNEPAFTGLDLIRPGDGTPVLEEALGYLDCRCASRQMVGDHELIVAQVVGGRLLGEGQPMVHLRKSGFHY